MNSQHIAPLAVSIGDPAGIGPELILQAWLARKEANIAPFFAVNGTYLLETAAKKLGLPVKVVAIEEPQEALEVFPNALPVYGPMDLEYHPGKPTISGAELAYDALELAIGLARDEQASGLVTAPVAKSQIAKIAPDFIGQTEHCADLCNAPRNDGVMLLAGPQLKVIPLTVHCAIADVPRLLTRELIIHRGRIAHQAMKQDFGIARPRLAFAGLNPHAGEDGRMGREEIETITPALKQLRKEGIDATGPHPADTLFAPHIRGSYDVALAMYHDQALAPMKALDFDQGVNMTLGLPIVRTSPDHGTAFNIAGTGKANPSSMIAALKMASEVAARRNQARNND